MPGPDGKPCIGLFEVGKLLENKRRNRPEQPCPICNEWQNIEELLHNAPAAQPKTIEEWLASIAEIKPALQGIQQQLAQQHNQVVGRFDQVDASSRELLSKVEGAYDGLMKTLVDEAKDGPRLFSFQPLDPGFFDRPHWVSQKFRLTLWCEHSRFLLPILNGEAKNKGSKAGVYELDLPREWVEKAAPLLKVLSGTLSLVLPVAAAATKLVLDEADLKGVEKELDLGEKSLECVLKGGEMAGAWLGSDDALELERGEAIRAQGAVWWQLQAWLKGKGPDLRWASACAE